MSLENIIAKRNLLEEHYKEYLEQVDIFINNQSEESKKRVKEKSAQFNRTKTNLNSEIRNYVRITRNSEVGIWR